MVWFQKISSIVSMSVLSYYVDDVHRFFVMPLCIIYIILGPQSLPPGYNECYIARLHNNYLRQTIV